MGIDEYKEITAPLHNIPNDGSRPILYINLVDIVGGHAKTPSGERRYDNYGSLTTASNLQLFHHRSNKRDKNAIAVFPYLPYFCEDFILGHVPRDYNKVILEASKEGLIISATVSYINEWFRNNDEYCEFPRYDANMIIKGYPKGDSPLIDLLYSRCHLSYAIAESFILAGFNSPESISAADDKELLAVKGVGPKSLFLLRKAYPKNKQQ